MKVLYLDLPMGAAGDMLTAALFELFDDRENILKELNSIGIPGVVFEAGKSEKNGIRGTQMSVKIHGAEEDEHTHHHGHHHDESTSGSIRSLIDSLNVSASIKENAKAVYDIIAAAEAEVHGTTVENIHFHEVGSLDAVADVTAVCLLLEKLSFDAVEASPVNLGSGTVKCAHGVLPVPAPATAAILRGMPAYGSEIKGELCTPTGAALLRHFVTRFGQMPPMKVSGIGYGMGKKDFERANCVRAFAGERAEMTDIVFSLSCNIDDMTGEDIGFAAGELMKSGALDVTLTPVYMKKWRPGVILTVLSSAEKREQTVRKIFELTSTIGVREEICSRNILRRVSAEKDGVPVKICDGYGAVKEKAEYDFIHRDDIK